MVKASMRKIKEVLRLHLECGLGKKKISMALKVSKGSVVSYVHRFEASGLTWPLAPSMTDKELESRLFLKAQEENSNEKSLPDFDWAVKELGNKHVTRKLLWQEYKDTHPEGMELSRYYELLNKHIVSNKLSMRIHHKGGDKLFVDYSGDGLSYVDRDTGELISVQLFLCSWGASSYSYAECTYTQGLEDWVGSHVRAFEYFGCVPAATVPDNLKSGVKKPDYYDPDINPTYAKLAEHYNTTILPARVRKPKDKAVVESNVLHVQRYILGRLRNRIFFSLSEINESVKELMEAFNAQSMQVYKVSRRERFEQIDTPNAKPLPADAFKIREIKIGVKVGPDYHIEYRKHFYSVPYTLALAGKRVEIHLAGHIVQIYCENERVASYHIGPANYSFTTTDAHMPASHQFVKGLNKSGLIFMAGKIGSYTSSLIKRTMDNKKHPELGYRQALGIINLKRQYPEDRVEKACARALHFDMIKRRDVLSILKKGLDKEPHPGKETHEKQLSIFHENIRGEGYYK